MGIEPYNKEIVSKLTPNVLTRICKPTCIFVELHRFNYSCFTLNTNRTLSVQLNNRPRASVAMLSILTIKIRTINIWHLLVQNKGLINIDKTGHDEFRTRSGITLEFSVNKIPVLRIADKSAIRYTKVFLLRSNRTLNMWYENKKFTMLVVGVIYNAPPQIRNNFMQST